MTSELYRTIVWNIKRHLAAKRKLRTSLQEVAQDLTGIQRREPVGQGLEHRLAVAPSSKDLELLDRSRAAFHHDYYDIFLDAFDQTTGEPVPPRYENWGHPYNHAMMSFIVERQHAFDASYFVLRAAPRGNDAMVTAPVAFSMSEEGIREKLYDLVTRSLAELSKRTGMKIHEPESIYDTTQTAYGVWRCPKP